MNKKCSYYPNQLAQGNCERCNRPICASDIRVYRQIHYKSDDSSYYTNHDYCILCNASALKSDYLRNGIVLGVIGIILALFAFRFDLGILTSILTAGIAVIISLYNYYLIRKGANLVIGEIVEMGVMKSTSSQPQVANIMCYLPLYFYNSGFAEAMITSIKVSIHNDGKKIPLYLTKRIRGRKFETIESLNPLLPIFIDQKSGKMEFFEFMTKEISLEKIDTIQVSVDYNNKTIIQEFQIGIIGNDIKEFPSLYWVNLYSKDPEHPKSMFFGKDMN